MKLTKHDIPLAVTLKRWRRIAKRQGVSWDAFSGRVRRGATPQEAADPKYRWRSKWDGVDTVADLCKGTDVTPRAVYQWKRRHPGHGLTDSQVVDIVSQNKESRRK